MPGHQPFRLYFWYYGATAIKAIGKALNRELQPEEQVPERLRQLLAQIEAKPRPGVIIVPRRGFPYTPYQKLNERAFFRVSGLR